MARMTGQENRAVWETLLRTVSSLMSTYEAELAESQGMALSWYDVLV